MEYFLEAGDYTLLEPERVLYLKGTANYELVINLSFIF